MYLQLVPMHPHLTGIWVASNDLAVMIHSQTGYVDISPFDCAHAPNYGVTSLIPHFGAWMQCTCSM